MSRSHLVFESLVEYNNVTDQTRGMSLSSITFTLGIHVYKCINTSFSTPFMLAEILYGTRHTLS